MKIIEADIGNIEEILAIENSSFTCPWSRKSFEDAFCSDNITIYTVTDEDGCVIAFSCLLIIEYEAEILNIAVCEKFRNNGVGKLLADHMINVCVQRDVDDIFLEVRNSNTSARRLYEKCGFVRIGSRKNYYINPTEDAILMKLSLGKMI